MRTMTERLIGSAVITPETAVLLIVVMLTLIGGCRATRQYDEPQDVRMTEIGK